MWKDRVQARCRKRQREGKMKKNLKKEIQGVKGGKIEIIGHLKMKDRIKWGGERKTEAGGGETRVGEECEDFN